MRSRRALTQKAGGVATLRIQTISWWRTLEQSLTYINNGLRGKVRGKVSH